MKELKEISSDIDSLEKSIKTEKKITTKKIRQLNNEIHNEKIQKDTFDEGYNDLKKDKIKLENELNEIQCGINEKIWSLEDNYEEEIKQLKKKIENEKNENKSKTKGFFLIF
jgi:phage host-nuclease inhibitor protein Gam